MLTNFVISGFKLFSELQIERLGRVNLIVGKNNAGKTALLEALRVYASGFRFRDFREILMGREELMAGPLKTRSHAVDLAALFHRDLHDPDEQTFRLGPAEHTLTCQLRTVKPFESGQRYRLLGEPKDTRADTPWEAVQALTVLAHPEARQEGYGYIDWNLELLEDLHSDKLDPMVLWPIFLPALRRWSNREIATLWDSIALTDAEEDIKTALQLVIREPVRGITLVEDPIAEGQRVVKLRLNGQPQPISLRSLGDGAVNLFQLALAMACANHQVLRERRALDTHAWSVQASNRGSMNLVLIDEIENGLHYSALPAVWSFLFEAARRNHAQVFATTHSWDCLHGFREALRLDQETYPAGDTDDPRAMVIRLERAGDTMRTVLIDDTMLPMVTREHIEVR